MFAYIIDPEVACMSGDVRLVGPQIWNTSSGRVEICIEGEWTSICNKSWDDKDAVVACKQMGLDYQSELDYILSLRCVHFGVCKRVPLTAL